VDYIDWREVDTVYDLNETPWPWSDNSVDGAIMIHILEHLDYYKTMNEIKRILKSKGRAYIIVPHYTNHRAHIGEHVHKGFSWVAFEHFKDPNHPFHCFNVIRNTIDFGQKLKPLTKVVNKFPMFYERFLAYFVPAVQVIVTLEKKDSEAYG